MRQVVVLWPGLLSARELASQDRQRSQGSFPSEDLTLNTASPVLCSASPFQTTLTLSRELVCLSILSRLLDFSTEPSSMAPNVLFKLQHQVSLEDRSSSTSSKMEFRPSTSSEEMNKLTCSRRSAEPSTFSTKQKRTSNKNSLISARNWVPMSPSTLWLVNCQVSSSWPWVTRQSLSPTEVCQTKTSVPSTQPS